MAKSVRTSVWLRPYESKQGHQVFIRVRTRDGFESEIPVYDYVNNVKLPISIKKENFIKGIITGGSYHISVRSINNLLANVEYRVKDAVYELLERNVPITRENIIRLSYINEESASNDEKRIVSGELIVNDDGGAFASQEEFEEHVIESSDPKFDKAKKILGVVRKEYILDYWDDFMNNYAPNSYNGSKSSITEYIQKSGDNCYASKYSKEWLERFFKHIIKNGYSLKKDGTNRKNYTVSTINRILKHLKSFGDYLFFDIKVLDNQEYRRFSLRKGVKKKSLLKYNPEPFINTHAIFKKEFDWFLGFKFEDEKLDVTRDMFVLQTWLGGLRQSDLYNLKPENITNLNGEYRVWFEQIKTDDEVFNIVNKNYLTAIFAKYPNKLPQFLKVHEYNDLLKVAAETAGLNRKLKFRVEDSSASEPTYSWHPIHEKICNKWARNCVVSILAELGYPDGWIAKVTGHKDMEMIRHYKQIHNKEIKLMLDEVKPEIVEKLD